MREREKLPSFLAVEREFESLSDETLTSRIRRSLDFGLDRPRLPDSFLIRAWSAWQESLIPPKAVELPGEGASGLVNPAFVLPITRSIALTNDHLLEIFAREPESLRRIDPYAFEQLVAELFEREGYRVLLTPPRKDGGKDLYVFKRDLLTQTVFLVECKRYSPPHKVGVAVARQLYGVVEAEGATGGIIATTSYFTSEADSFAKTRPYRLYLRNFDDLSAWLQRALKKKGTAS